MSKNWESPGKFTIDSFAPPDMKRGCPSLWNPSKTSTLPGRCSGITQLRAEGIALTDPETGLTDLRMPEEGTDGHAALLLADFYAAHLRSPRAQSAIPWSRSEQHLRQCAKEHAHRWRRDTRDPAGLRNLHRSVVHRLCALNLLRQTGEDLHPQPAIARYRLAVGKKDF